jgi:FkbM family methyltransferase
MRLTQILKELKELNIKNNNQKIFDDPYLIKTTAGIVDTSFDFYITNNNGKSWYDKTEIFKDSIQSSISTELIFSLLLFKFNLCLDDINYIVENAKPYSSKITDLYKKYKDTIEKNDVMFDIGCHQGFYSLGYSKYYSKIIAAEPFPQNFLTTELNFILNGLSNNIEIFPFFVSEKKYEGILSHSQQRLIGMSAPNEDSFITKSICLDDLIQYNPSFIKIDTEGEEIKVLKGAKQILSTYPHLLIECHKEIDKTLNLNEIRSLIDFDRYICLGIKYQKHHICKIESDHDLNEYKYLYLLSKSRLTKI